MGWKLAQVQRMSLVPVQVQCMLLVRHTARVVEYRMGWKLAQVQRMSLVLVQVQCMLLVPYRWWLVLHRWWLVLHTWQEQAERKSSQALDRLVVVLHRTLLLELHKSSQGLSTSGPPLQLVLQFDRRQPLELLQCRTSCLTAMEEEKVTCEVGSFGP